MASESSVPSGNTAPASAPAVPPLFAQLCPLLPFLPHQGLGCGLFGCLPLSLQVPETGPSTEVQSLGPGVTFWLH